MPAAPAKRENLVLNLVCNVALPTLVLTKLSADHWLGPVWALLTALSFPTAYGIYDFVRRRKTNLISVLGFVSVLLTGGLGLTKADRMWFAVKEASVPLLIGVFVVATSRSKKSLVREMVYNDQIFDTDRINAALIERGKTVAFERSFSNASWLIGGSFLLSAILNYALAVYFLQSEPGTPAFNAELGRMNAVSYPVIALPSMAVMLFAIWRLFTAIEAETGLNMEQLMRQQQAGAPLKQVLFSFHGRAGREAFWTTTLGFLALALAAIGAARSGKNLKILLACAAFFVGAWVVVATQIKRWHDRDRSGWMVLINAVPVIGTLWSLIELGMLPGTRGTNRFGNDPRERRGAEQVTRGS